MGTTLENITLPENPSKSTATTGKDHLLSINTGTIAVPEWQLVGGQRNAALNEKADSIDASHKTSGGWKSTLPGMKSWSIDYSGLGMLGDIGVAAMQKAFRDSLQVNVKFEYPDGSYQTGWASMTSYSLDTPHDGVTTLKTSLEGVGPLSETQAAVTATLTPTSASFTKATLADVSLTISPATTTVRSISNNGVVLTSGTDYTYSSGALKILKEYLAAQTNGSVVLLIDTPANDLTETITVGA